MMTKNVLEEYIDKIGGFDNFHGTVFSLLPLKDRKEILIREYSIRPSFKVLDKLLLVLAKLGNKKELDKYINEGYNIGFFKNNFGPEDYLSFLKKGPTIVITPGRSLELLKEHFLHYDLPKEQLQICIDYIGKKYFSLNVNLKNFKSNFKIKIDDNFVASLQLKFISLIKKKIKIY